MLQRLAVVLCAAALTAACGQSDAGITTAVKAKLAADTMVKAYEIDVDTNNRVVTLSGEVETSVAKDQALKLARETDGVRDVVDQLRVGESAATAGVLGADDAADARESGERAGERAGAAADRAGDRAGEAADRAGDRAGQAADRAGEAVTDAGITSAVKAKLLADQTVSGLAIDVDTNGGVVTLTGEVNTRAEADQALMLARGTEGVSRVVDKLRVGR